MRKTLEERLWGNIRKAGPNECWEWEAKSRTSFGYGIIRVGGTPGRLVMTHRLVWELTNGPIPEGLCVLHDCDNPPCCNPGHLHLGTKADNMRERRERGHANPRREPKKVCRNGHSKGPGRCPVCAREAQLKWLANNPLYHRDWKRARVAKE